uniref:Uncharacterized protein n=1 Tax=Aureoumbra lagunensis TaxID=44058 RepID=A0A7S3NKX2_9STRA|mmetsp:Transcript_19950/g.24175  ORF Transcript_19950/g.24175 Transcript_19950/m.24175 type:complete len:188 (+) Transcript_19950:35-598(+)
MNTHNQDTITPGKTPLERQAISDARSILATYKASKKIGTPQVVTTNSPLFLSDSSRLGNKARELERLCEEAERISQELRAVANVTPTRASELRDSTVLELTRALTRATTTRDQTVAALDDENRQLRKENANLRDRVAQYQRQLDELAISFDSLLLCLNYQPLRSSPSATNDTDDHSVRRKSAVDTLP